MNQRLLFDNAPEPAATARQSDPITSHIAADSVESSGKASAQRTVCLQYVRQHPGHTSAEIAAALGVSRYMPARRLPELRMAGLVKRGKKRKCRQHGTLAMTWEPIEHPSPEHI